MLEAQPCRTCALKATDQNGINFCQLTRQQIDLDKDFCSKHQTTLTQCEICHQYLAGLPFIVRSLNYVVKIALTDCKNRQKSKSLEYLNSKLFIVIKVMNY